MVNFTPFTGSTPVSQVEINRRFYELDGVLEDIKDGDYYGAAGSLSIAGGVIVIANESYVTVAAEGAPTTDNLDTINGTVAGQIIVLQAAAGDTITLTSGVGNIVTPDGNSVSMSGNIQFQLIDDGTNLRVMNSAVAGLFADFVAHTTFGAPVANVNLTSIPATAAHLLLIGGFRSDNVSNRDGIDITFNGDVAGNYFRIAIEDNSAATNKSQGLSQNEIKMVDAAAAASATANYVGVFKLTIFDYLNVARPRHVHWQNYVQFNDSSTNLFVGQGGGIWKNTTAALNRITITPDSGSNWDEGFYALYGLGASA